MTAFSKILKCLVLAFTITGQPAFCQTSGGFELVQSDWPQAGDLLVLYEVALNTEVEGVYAASGFISMREPQSTIDVYNNNNDLAPDQTITPNIGSYQSIGFTAAFDCNLRRVSGTFKIEYFAEKNGPFRVRQGALEFVEPIHSVVVPRSFPPVQNRSLVDSVCRRALLIG